MTLISTSAFLDAFRRVRPIQRQLGTIASKKIGKPAIASEAKMIGLWRQGSLELEAEEELNTLFDHLSTANRMKPRRRCWRRVSVAEPPHRKVLETYVP